MHFIPFKNPQKIIIIIIIKSLNPTLGQNLLCIINLKLHYENISIERMHNFRLTCSHRSIHESKTTQKGRVFKLNQA